MDLGALRGFAAASNAGSSDAGDDGRPMPQEVLVSYTCVVRTC